MPEDPSQPTPEDTRRLPRALSPSWAQRKRMLRLEAWCVLAACYPMLAFAYLWPPDFRNGSSGYVAVAWTAFMLRTFSFHLGLLLFLIGAVAGAYRVWRMVLVTVPLLLITLGPTVRRHFPPAPCSVAGETVTVMSVNLLMINELTSPIIEEIRNTSPDVLLLQEYTWNWHKALQQALSADYPFVEYVMQEDSFGAAIYSRRPFEERPEAYLPLGAVSTPQLRTVISVSGERVAFYNIHLLPPWGLEYTIEQRTQFADLLELLAEESIPVVMGGDFNFTENSPYASALADLNAVDAFDLGGWGRGTTWPVNGAFRWIPSLRLDHIYLRGGLTCVRCRTGVGRGSDHRPVIAEIGFGK
ncbi:MAG: hypothetical protein GY842_10025 [bacterium]|nr:hypothetical protein [bacterium]